MLLIILTPFTFAASINSEEGLAPGDVGFQDTATQGSFGPEQYLGEAIILNVYEQEPHVVRQSFLEQQDVPVFIYLRGLTVGNLLSPITDDPSARDPLQGITNIPPIDHIDVRQNLTKDSKDFIRFVQYIPPQKDKYSLNNLGYLMIYLKRIDSEQDLPENNTINLNLDAKIYLKLEESNLLGVSQQDLVVKQYPEEKEFLKYKEDHSFFSNKGFIRATRIGTDSATIVVYNKNLNPISLHTTQPSPSTSGVTQRSVITLTKGQTSPPLSFGYTGNPLNDLFRIKLEDVSFPRDKAEVELQINGRNTLRKVPINGRLHSFSSWIVTRVTKEATPPVLITNANLEDVAEEFNLNPQQKNQLTSLIAQTKTAGEAPRIETHQVSLESQYSRETKELTRRIITTGSESVFKNYQPIDSNRVDFLHHQYCNDEKDYACIAANKFREVIEKYPDSPEATLAKRDLAELYANFLIEYPSCNPDNTGTKAQNEQECKNFQLDMLDLALYYYAQIGEEDKILDIFGSITTTEYLEDEGISIKLKRAIYENDEQSSAFLRVYTDPTNFKDLSALNPGAEIKELGDNNIRYNEKDSHVWRVENIHPTSTNIRLYRKDQNNQYTATSLLRTIKLNERQSIEVKFPELDQNKRPIGSPEVKDIQLTKVDSSNEAYLTIIPGIGRAFTTSNFNVHIQIDPRPFKLTPDQLESQINTTRTIINDLNKVITDLDEFISTMKKLCLGAFAFLTLKNTLQGGARAIARRESSDFWKQRCANEVRADKKFQTIDRCLSHYSSEIKSTTDRTESHIKDLNSGISGKTAEELKTSDFTEGSTSSVVEGGCGTFEAFREGSLSLNGNDKVRSYRDCALNARLNSDSLTDSKYQSYQSEKLQQSGVKDTSEVYNQAKKILKTQGGDENDQTHVRAVIAQLNTKKAQQKDSILHSVIPEDINPGEWSATAYLPNPIATKPEDALTQAKLHGLSEYDQILIRNDYDPEKAKEDICEKQLSGEWKDKGCISGRGTQPDVTLQIPTEIEKLKLKPGNAPGSNQQQYVSEVFYNRVINIAGSTQRPDLSKIEDPVDCVKIGAKFDGKCEPEIYTTTLSADTAGRSINGAYSEKDLKAQYDGEGLPYCYPTGNGEYVTVLNRFKSNEIEKLRVWNVGPNGRIECGGGDDEIVVDETVLETQKNLKQKYLRAAPKKRCTATGGSGNAKEGDIVGKTPDGKHNIVCSTQGAEVLDSLANPKCIDVMDPADCKILFNFCDPVMCPSSRCTFGGRFPPRNVIQSGLIGSTLLCLPNFKEGVYIPVCLTGISAGLKNIRSILEGYATCLEINLKEGKHVGFCDYISAVGICEMVWREANTVLDIGSKGIIDWLSGKLFGAPDGGGEYLTFESSLQNVGDSVRVFTEEYKTTYTAQFLSQSTEEIGSEICRLQVNGKLPNIGQILDHITQPEDPPQFTAFFDEVPYASTGDSRTSVPGTQLGTAGSQGELSLYKVFYHIYAGTGYYQGSYTEPQSLFAPGTEPGPSQPIVYSVYLINREQNYRPVYVTFPERGGGTGSSFAPGFGGGFSSGDLGNSLTGFQQNNLQPSQFGGGFQTGSANQFAVQRGLQGRIDPGRFAQETVQKIAQKGYNQICVNINGIEECGFGRTSSSFGLNELKDAVTAQGAATEIKSADECVPNSRNSKSHSIARLGALGASVAVGGVAPGLVTSGLDNQLYSQGLTRVCSVTEPTQDPGRWQVVGSCGADDNGKERGSCWLDLNSVSIDDIELNNKLKTELTARADSSLRIIDEDTSKSALSTLNEGRDSVIERIRELVEEAKRSGKVPPQLKIGLSQIIVSTQTSAQTTTITQLQNGAALRQWPVSPIEGKLINSCYGSRNNPTDPSKGSEWHDGIDIGGSTGDKILAIEDGIVEDYCQGNCGGYGNNVIMKHDSGIYARYSHLDKIDSIVLKFDKSKKNNIKIDKNQQIGTMGNTGRSTGTHLDLKIYLTDNFQPDVGGKGSYDRDPLKYLPKIDKPTGRNCADSPTIKDIYD
ncbi:M23 family metallopeptidase [Candidatus Woesearchaeota archaeon]|nr:M23 family metallopeptidase [Candidatus Woesearchaeota archaeon]